MFGCLAVYACRKTTRSMKSENSLFRSVEKAYETLYRDIQNKKKAKRIYSSCLKFVPQFTFRWEKRQARKPSTRSEETFFFLALNENSFFFARNKSFHVLEASTTNFSFPVRTEDRKCLHGWDEETSYKRVGCSMKD